MRKQIKYFSPFLLLFFVTLGFSQRKENDTLNTGVIDVVKPYTPSISDAFKVKEEPTLDDETTNNKKEVKYNIFSFPVASTFTPAKGKAAVIEKKPRPKLYDNYATLAFGTYTTFVGEVYLNHAISRTESVGGYFTHHSSQGGIEEVVLDDDFYNSKLKLNYSSQLRDMAWNVEGGFQHQYFNWYGLDEGLSNNDFLIQNLDVGHSFFNANVAADVSFEDTYINSGDVLFRHFSDSEGSSENHFVLNGKVDVPINDFEISTDFKFDYLGGGFDKGYFTQEELNYGNIQVGLSPSYQIKQEDLTLNLGVSLFYMNDFENGDNKFFVYPNISASYRLVSDVLIAYGGMKGDLVQNTYHQFTSENPFVSPTLLVMPTDQAFNAYLGLKGKVSSNMSYNIGGFYKSENDKALYRNNSQIIDFNNFDSYQFGNSFGLVYDDVNTFGVFGEFNVDVNRNFKLALKAEYFGYSADKEEEAWNLPEIKGSLFLDYQIDEHWFAGANLFFVGEREDLISEFSTIEIRSMQVTLDSYFDANAHVGYHINDQFSFFARANNIANTAYQKWQNFPVQGLQFLAGATYKFDF